MLNPSAPEFDPALHYRNLPPHLQYFLYHLAQSRNPPAMRASYGLQPAHANATTTQYRQHPSMSNPANHQLNNHPINQYHPGHPLYLSAMARMRKVLDARVATATTVTPFEQWLQGQPVALEHYAAWRNEQILPRIRGELAEHRRNAGRLRVKERHRTVSGMMQVQDNRHTGPFDATQDLERPFESLEDIWKDGQTLQELGLHMGRQLAPEELLDFDLDIQAIIEEGRLELDEYQGSLEPIADTSTTEPMGDENEPTPRAIPLNLVTTAGEAVTGPE